LNQPQRKAIQLASILGKGKGLFDLSKSDTKPGSYFTKGDLAEIFGIEESAFRALSEVEVDGIHGINESEVQNAWYSGAIPNAPAFRIRNFQRSFDELVLAALMRRTYPELKIEEQVKWERRSLDFVVEHPVFGKRIVEFDGPSHFAQSGYGKEIKNPSIRKEEAEQHFGMEYVSWPYWIQRCESNVRALFEPGVQGYGLLWSANTHFGHFAFEDSAEVILKLSSRFNAIRDGGLAYIYGPNTAGRTNVEHPVISSIERGRIPVSRILPRGYLDKSTWLPERLMNG